MRLRLMTSCLLFVLCTPSEDTNGYVIFGDCAIFSKENSSYLYMDPGDGQSYKGVVLNGGFNLVKPS